MKKARITRLVALALGIIVLAGVGVGVAAAKSNDNKKFTVWEDDKSGPSTWLPLAGPPPLHPAVPRSLTGRLTGRSLLGARSRQRPYCRVRRGAARSPPAHQRTTRYTDGRGAARDDRAGRHRAHG